MISGSRADVAMQLFGDDLDDADRARTQASARIAATTPGRRRRARRARARAADAADPRRPRAPGALRHPRRRRAHGRRGHAPGHAGRLRVRGPAPLRSARCSCRRSRSAPRRSAACRSARATASWSRSRRSPITEEDGPAQISRESMQRRLRVDVNIRGRDLVSFVDDAKARVADERAAARRLRASSGAVSSRTSSAPARGSRSCCRWRSAIIFGDAVHDLRQRALRARGVLRRAVRADRRHRRAQAARACRSAFRRPWASSRCAASRCSTAW